MNIKEKNISIQWYYIFLQKFELPPTHIVGSAYGIQIKYKKSKIIAAKTQINGIDIKNTNIFSTTFFFKQINIYIYTFLQTGGYYIQIGRIEKPQPGSSNIEFMQAYKDSVSQGVGFQSGK